MFNESEVSGRTVDQSRNAGPARGGNPGLARMLASLVPDGRGLTELKHGTSRPGEACGYLC